MEKYLLLRSNKKSGPYSLEELLSAGLKPYDLVWVEGKSAAWRYPSEVDALKAYAPVAEEQPYDRFYKKPEERKVSAPVMQVKEKPITQVVDTTPIESQVIEVPKEPIIPQVEIRTTTTPKKVFVSMPENHITKPVQSQPVHVKAPIIEEKPKIIEETKVEPRPLYMKPATTINERIGYNQRALSNEEDPELSEKYSESLDDIKRRYAETYLNRKKKAKMTSTYKSLLQIVGAAVFFCAIVVLIYKGFGEDNKAQQLTKTTVIEPQKNNGTSQTATVANTSATNTQATTNKKTEKKSFTKKEETNRTSENPITSNTNASTPKQKNEAVTKRNDDLFAFDTKEVKSKSYEESKSEEIKPKIRVININKLVSVKANNYKQRAFGGVMNLELTVHNDSRFDLEKVIVELQYLKPSEQPIKTERIVFNSIGANNSETLKIPDYLRGVKVAYRIIEIESSQYERYTAGL